MFGPSNPLNGETCSQKNRQFSLIIIGGVSQWYSYFYFWYIFFTIRIQALIVHNSFTVDNGKHHPRPHASMYTIPTRIHTHLCNRNRSRQNLLRDSFSEGKYVLVTTREIWLKRSLRKVLLRGDYLRRPWVGKILNGSKDDPNKSQNLRKKRVISSKRLRKGSHLPPP